MALLKEDIERLSECDKDRILVFDTETTGITRKKGMAITFNQEIIQISILNGSGNVLYSSLIKPKTRKRWPAAQEINKITPEKVKDAPHFSEVREEIQRYFDKAKFVVGYNVGFDIKFVEAAGIFIPPLAKKIDVLEMFKQYKELKGIKTADNKLTTCAKNFGVSFDAHNAEYDARATLSCLNELLSAYTAEKRIATGHGIAEGKQKATDPQAQHVKLKHRRFHLLHSKRWLRILCSVIIAFLCLVILSQIPSELGPVQVTAIIVFLISAIYAVVAVLVSVLKTIIGVIGIIFRKIFKHR